MVWYHAKGRGVEGGAGGRDSKRVPPGAISVIKGKLDWYYFLL